MIHTVQPNYHIAEPRKACHGKVCPVAVQRCNYGVRAASIGQFENLNDSARCKDTVALRPWNLDRCLIVTLIEVCSIDSTESIVLSGR